MKTVDTMVEPRSVYGFYRGKRQTEEGENIHTFVASTSDPDRHRTVLNQENWRLDNFRDNPIIGYQHNVYGDMCSAPDPDDVVGKAIKTYVEDGKLMVDLVFDKENEKGRKIESKVDRGFLNAVSVGFMEIGDGHMGNEDDGEDKDLYYFHGQELLEVSVVNIPSNPRAKKKSIRNQTFDALRFVYRELGGRFRFSDIENMTVRQILDEMEGKEKPVEEESPVTITKRRYVFYTDKGEFITDLTK